jgi:peptidoglycan/xylan/chitin deacetylase (PgdA/CDA1 family)
MRHTASRLPWLVALLTIACAGTPRATTVAPERVPDRLVVLTFDDAVRSHYTTVAPLLERYGFGATFFVTEFPDPPFSDTTLYMTWPQMAELGRRGFEIANHTWHHTHVDRMDAARFHGEMQYIEEKLRALGLPAPVSFAYPAYVTTPDAVRLLRERGYTFARTGGDRAYDPVRDDPMLVPSWTLRETSRDTILNALREARDGRIVVLTIHGVPDTAHPWVTTPVAIFDDLHRALRDGGYRVVAMRDVARYLPAGRRPAATHAAPR